MTMIRGLTRVAVEWGVVFGAAALIEWSGNFWLNALIILIVANFSASWIKWVERNWPDTVV